MLAACTRGATHGPMQSVILLRTSVTKSILLNFLTIFYIIFLVHPRFLADFLKHVPIVCKHNTNIGYACARLAGALLPRIKACVLLITARNDLLEVVQSGA